MDKHAQLFIYDNMLAMGAYWVCSGSVIAAMTNYYNIPLGPANMLTGITATFTLLQIIGGLLFSKAKNKVTFLYIINFIWRLAMPILFFSVFLGQSIGALVFVIAFILVVAFMQMTTPAQIAWSVDATEGKVGQSFFTQREMWFMFVHALLFFLAGLIIDASQKGGWEKNGFISLGVLLGSAIIASIVIMLKLPTQCLKIKVNQNLQNANEKKHTKDLILNVLKNKPFMMVLLASSLWNFSNMFANQFALVYQVRMANVPFSSILLWTSLGYLLRALIAPQVQKLAKKISWQRVVQLAAFSMLVANIGWIFVNDSNKLILYPFISIGSAMSFAGISVGFLQMQVNTISPGEDRTVFFSVLATSNGICALIGSFLSSAIIGVIEDNSVAGDVDLRMIFILGIIFIAITIISAQFIGQHKLVQANMLKKAISNAREKYPHAILPPQKKIERKISIFNLFRK